MQFPRLATSVLLFLMIILFILIMSNIAIKGVRFLIDQQQYGKAYSTIEVKFENEDDRKRFESYDTEQRVDAYRSILESLGRYASWPLVTNFQTEWTTHAKTSTLPRQSLWFVRSIESIERRILFFVHGGATFAGSPHKYNNLHWLKTIGWLGGIENRYTDIVSIDYRLRPEHAINDSIDDCLSSITRVLAEYNDNDPTERKLDAVYLLGFSAGAMLALQCAILIEIGLSPSSPPPPSSESTTGHPNDTRVFEIDVASNHSLVKLCNKYGGLWHKVRQRHLYLLAPLCRLDRLFINDAFDVSPIIAIFSDAFFDQKSDQYDPLFTIAKHHLTLGSFDHVCIIDACRNSLSNDAIHLESILRPRRPNANKVKLLLLDEMDLLVDDRLAKKIREYELRVGRKPNKYLRYDRHFSDTNQRSTTSPRGGNNGTTSNETSTAKRGYNLANFIHYHFFLYIVPCNASWRTLKTILRC